MQHGTYDDFWKARNLRPHLKNIKPAVMTVGGWFDAENLFGALETYQGTSRPTARATEQHPGHGALGPRRLERRGDGDDAGRRHLQRQDRRVLPREDRVAVLRVPPQGQGRRSSIPKAWVFETGTNHWRQVRRLAAASRPSRDRCISARRRQAGDRAAADASADDGYDEYVSDPAKPVPYHRQDRHRHDAGVHDRPTSASPRAGPTCWSTRPTCSTEDLTIAGPIQVELHVSTTGTDSDWIVKLIDVYPDDYPDPEPEPDRRADGRLPATGARRRDARQVPQQLREAGAVHARQADRGEVHAAGRLPHVPHRPPDHGAGAEQLVPAGGPQPADVRRHLHGRRRPISRRRRSGSTTTPRTDRALRSGW